MEIVISERVGQILGRYAPNAPEVTADALCKIWLKFDLKTVDSIQIEDREKQETVGILAKLLQKIGKEMGKAARKRVDDYLNLARL